MPLDKKVALGADRKIVRLGALINDRSSNARIYSLDTDEDRMPLAVKIYRQGVPGDIELVLEKSLATLGKRVIRRGYYGNAEGTYPVVAAPRALVYSPLNRSEVCGIAMRRLPSAFQTLDSYLTSTALQDRRLATTMATNLAAVVGRLHESKYVIGDLSPSNILVDRDGNLAVVDVDSFGFTMDGVRRSPQDHTPGYIAPKRLIQNGKDEQSDLFVLGILVLHLLIGIDPYEGTLKKCSGSTNRQQLIDSGLSWLTSRNSFNLRPRVEQHPGLDALPVDVVDLIWPMLTGNERIRSSEDWLPILQSVSGELVLCACSSTRFASARCGTCGEGQHRAARRLPDDGETFVDTRLLPPGHLEPVEEEAEESDEDGTIQWLSTSEPVEEAVAPLAEDEPAVDKREVIGAIAALVVVVGVVILAVVVLINLLGSG